ncbi:hypothetical protein GCM10027614_24510 [Micromonospora vulcania]
MTISAVRTHRVSAPLHTPFVTALRRTTTVDTLLVELIDSDGRSGFGEAPQVWQVTGASVAGAQACVRELLGPLLTGRDPDDLVARCAEVQRAVVGNEAAKAAVDVALHDLAARRLGVPWCGCSAAPRCGCPRTSRWPRATPWTSRRPRGNDGPTASTCSN